MQEIIELRLRSSKLDGSLDLVHHRETNLSCCYELSQSVAQRRLQVGEAGAIGNSKYMNLS